METSIVDPASGAAQPWDWSQSGVAEIDCFLCHWPQPDNAARLAALAEGRYADAATATLGDSGFVRWQDGRWVYDAAAFDAAGNLRPEFVRLADPAVANCGTCHAPAHNDLGTPLDFSALSAAAAAAREYGMNGLADRLEKAAG